MKKKKSHKGIMILILIIIGVCIYFYVFKGNEEAETTSTITETTTIKTTILNSISTTSEVASSLNEKVELHATYYFEEIYVEENQYVEEGENLLEYTNGTYLVAPYDCVITEISVPEEDEQCTNEHYINIEATDVLTMTLTVDETELDTVYIGQEAQITINILEDTTYTGYVTNISSTASYSSNGSNFTVTVEFQNDGNIMIGMSATCNVILEKAEDVIAVPTEAIQEDGKTKYVVVKKEDGTTENVTIETGISNDAYTEVKSGNITENQTVLIYEEEETETNRSNMQSGGDRGSSDFGQDAGQMSGSPMDSAMPSMPGNQ